MSDDLFVETVLAIIGVYSLALIVFGTVANVFSVGVCLRKNLRKVPTFIFYCFLLINDTLCLYVWNLDHYLLKFHNYQLEDLGLHMCRFVTLWQLLSFQCSAWLLVAMTVERYLSVKVKSWRLIFKRKFTLLTVFIIHFVLLGMNIKFAVSIMYSENGEFVSNVTCFGAEGYREYMQQNNIVYFCIPFIIMTVANCLLFYELNYKKPKSPDLLTKAKMSKRRAISYTVLLLSTLFMLLTAPDAIANAFYVPFLFETRARIAILFFLDSIAFTFHSCNFVALLTTNKQFLREVKACLRFCKKSSRVDVFDRNQVTMTRQNTKTNAF